MLLLKASAVFDEVKRLSILEMPINFIISFKPLLMSAFLAAALGFNEASEMPSAWSEEVAGI